MSPRSNRKPSTSKKHMTSMSCRLEPAIWSRDTGQQILCFDRCQLTITWMSNVKEVHGKPRLHVSVNLLFGGWPPSCATSTVVGAVVVVRTRPRAIQLAMITMRKSIHGFPLVSYMGLGLRLAALRAAGAPLLESLSMTFTADGKRLRLLLIFYSFLVILK